MPIGPERPTPRDQGGHADAEHDEDTLRFIPFAVVWGVVAAERPLDPEHSFILVSRGQTYQAMNPMTNNHMT
jgi:hypothetical protein